MPINRFEKELKKQNAYDEYIEKLVNAFNPEAADGIMCRNLISVSHDGKIYDCDFNQMLEMQARNGNGGLTIFNFDLGQAIKRKIRFGVHCFGCTAGAGSSCGGQTVS